MEEIRPRQAHPEAPHWHKLPLEMQCAPHCDLPVDSRFSAALPMANDTARLCPASPGLARARQASLDLARPLQKHSETLCVFGRVCVRWILSG